jgi:hypothetical protein
MNLALDGVEQPDSSAVYAARLTAAVGPHRIANDGDALDHRRQRAWKWSIYPPEINQMGASYDRIKMQLNYRREIHYDQVARHDGASATPRQSSTQNR